MIGHLQRNKVKYIVDKVCLIHSVDSLRLAEQNWLQMQRKREKKNPVKAPVQANQKVNNVSSPVKQ